MDLRFLVENLYVSPRQTSGFLAQMPIALQQSAAVAMIDFIMSDPIPTLRRTVRSAEDLTYLTETVGVVFTFSSSEFAASIRKGMDLYTLLFSVPLWTQLKPFYEGEDANAVELLKQDRLVEAVRQMAQLYELRPDHPNGSVTHIQLVARLVDNTARLLMQHEGKLFPETWASLLKILLGCFHFVCSTPEVPKELRLSVGSLVFECILRGKITDAVSWAMLGERLPLTYATASQWSVSLVALTHVVAMHISGRATPPCVPLAWRGMLEGIRHVSNLVTLTFDEAGVLWKRMCLLLNPLRLTPLNAANVAFEAIRDSVMILQSASYWPLAKGSLECESMRDVMDLATSSSIVVQKGSARRTVSPDSRCSRYVPFGPSTSSILQVWGECLLHAAVGSIHRTQTVLDSQLTEVDIGRSIGIVGLCAVVLRRESEFDQCPTTYVDAFESIIRDVLNSGSLYLRCRVLLHCVDLFQLNLPWSSQLLTALGTFACELLAEVSGSKLTYPGTEDDDDDEETASPHRRIEETDDPFAGLEADDGVIHPEEAVEVRRAAITTAVNVAVCMFSLKPDVRIVAGVLTALSHSLIRHVRTSDLVQRVLSAVQLLLEHTVLTTNLAQDLDAVRPMLASMLEVGLSLLRARCGTHDPHSLSAVLRFVAWAMPVVAVNEGECRPVLLELVTFAAATRSVAESATVSTDVSTLSLLYVGSVTCVAELLCDTRLSNTIRGSTSCMNLIAQLLDVSMRFIVRPESANMRHAHHRLMVALEKGWSWDRSHERASETTLTEKDFVGVTSSIRCVIVGTSRVISILQIDTAKVDALSSEHPARSWLRGAEVVLISRCAIGRRVWCLREVSELMDGHMGATPMSPRTSPSAGFPVPGFESPSGSFAGASAAITNSLSRAPTCLATRTIADDMLREVDHAPRTKLLLDGWSADPDIQALCEKLRGKSAEGREHSLFRLYPWYFQGWDVPLSSREVVPEDKAPLQCRLARRVAHGLGLNTSLSREIKIDATSVGKLAALDACEDETEIRVDILYLHDTVTPTHSASFDSRDAFQAFVEGLGWSAPTRPTERDTWRVAATPTLTMHFRVRSVPIEAFSLFQDGSEEAIDSNVAASLVRSTLRILWDSSSTRYDWGSVDTALHRLLRTRVCTSMRSVRHVSYADLLLRPLPFHNVVVSSVLLPDHHGLGDTDGPLAQWAGPLQTSSIATLSVLPRLVRQVVAGHWNTFYLQNGLPSKREAMLSQLAACYAESGLASEAWASSYCSGVVSA